MLFRLKYIKTCITVIVMSLCGISMSLPVHSMQSPLKRSNQGKQEDVVYKGLRHSVETKHVLMNEKTAMSLILLYLSRRDINNLTIDKAMETYLDRVIKNAVTRPIIVERSDGQFEDEIINPFLQDLMKNRTLTEEGHYILDKTLHQVMIESAIILFKEHFSQPSPKQKIKNVVTKVKKRISKKKQYLGAVNAAELAPEYGVAKKTISLHGLLLMKLLRSAVVHQIKLEDNILQEAVTQAQFFLDSLGLEEDAIDPLIEALRNVKIKPLSKELRESQKAPLIAMGEKGINRNKKVVLVLSLDGGGTKGLYTARLLAEIEARCQRYISQIFDIIAGASTGGILSLALTTPAAEPNPTRKPKYRAKEVILLYERLAETVFPHQSKAKKLLKTIYGNQFDADALESILKEEFGETTLSQTLRNVIIPAYNIKTHDTKYFKTREAIRNPAHENPLLHDLARFTSAAPTYFTPAEHETGDLFVDGGITTNNPSKVAYEEALEAFPNAEKIMLISLGTTKALQRPKASKGGLLDNMDTLVESMEQQSKTVDQELTTYSAKSPEKFTYFRINEIIKKPIDLAHSDRKTLDDLLGLAEKTIASNEWETMIAQLKNYIRENEGGENLREARSNLRSSSNSLRSSSQGLRSSKPFN
ncbi:MAG: patatin-like phospholipase family protein [Alphaproteobacteria bacterium]|nr:patatin-like phospholipase family protein [Alphaproteobacteria bacterium]